MTPGRPLSDDVITHQRVGVRTPLTRLGDRAKGGCRFDVGCSHWDDIRRVGSELTDKYVLGQQLRGKEFCEICVARERSSGQLYSCKRYSKKSGRSVRRAARMEIRILKMVKHPNILQLIETFETRQEYFIIQDLAMGGDLFDWILDRGTYTEMDAREVVKQVLQTISYLHSLNIVHRNIKLENLMYYRLDSHCKVVIGDFHLARIEMGPISDPCGTPEYLV
ncbi:caM kinase-like vesicle-associated protein [Chiloscyllium punctatum]|uniref:caM kinase-like vesicle-associated protein n=1 Tax=Chiloscyllium punctatum TaxID=137246 RepID=UPI003B632B82